jgi:hypothetical protein
MKEMADNVQGILHFVHEDVAFKWKVGNEATTFAPKNFSIKGSFTEVAASFPC